MMKLLSYISTLASVIYLTVGLNTYHLNKKAKEGFNFLILTITLSIWSFAFSFVYTAENLYIYSFWNKISAIGWCFFPVLVLQLVLSITKSNLLKSFRWKLLLYIPAFILFFMVVFLFGPDIVTSNIISTIFYIGDLLYNNIYILLSIVIMYLWSKGKNNKYQKKQGRIIVITSLIPFVLNLITQTILPLVGIDGIPNVSQIYSLIMLFGVQYAIMNYNFLLTTNSLIIDEVFHEIMDLTFVIDLEGKIIRTNKQVNHLLYYSIEELKNRALSEIINEKRLISLIENCESVVNSIKLNNVVIKTKRGEPIPVNITVSPILDSKNQILLGLLIVGQDIRIINSLRDEIYNHKETTDKLKVSEELFRTIAETIPFAVILTKRSDNRIIYLNKITEELLRIKKDKLLGELPHTFYFHSEVRNQLIQDLEDGKQVKEREVLFRRYDNSIFSGLITMVPTLYNGQEVLLSCVIDLTEKKVLEQSIIKSEEMFRKLMDSIPDLVLVSDMEGNITFTNKSIQTVLGYDLENDRLPENILHFLEHKDIDSAKMDMKRIIQGDIGPIEYKHFKKSGALVDVEIHGTILKEETQEAFGYIFVTRDISERKKVQEDLKKSKEEIEKMNNELIKSNQLLHEKSIRDSLTNLYNHQYIKDLLENELLIAKQKDYDLCLIMLDIDLFKQINDKHGHQTGDKVLDNVSKLIQLGVRDHDYVGRYGGEEFMIILPQIDLEGAYQIADNIRMSIQNFAFTRKKINVTVSMGLAKLQEEDTKSFINRADNFLYLAKNNGRNQIVH